MRGPACTTNTCAVHRVRAVGPVASGQHGLNHRRHKHQQKDHRTRGKGDPASRRKFEESSYHVILPSMKCQVQSVDPHSNLASKKTGRFLLALRGHSSIPRERELIENVPDVFAHQTAWLSRRPTALAGGATGLACHVPGLAREAEGLAGHGEGLARHLPSLAGHSRRLAHDAPSLACHAGSLADHVQALRGDLARLTDHVAAQRGWVHQTRSYLHRRRLGRKGGSYRARTRYRRRRFIRRRLTARRRLPIPVMMRCVAKTQRRTR
jgi:hypothetical protein